MGDGLSQQDAAADLANLALGVTQVEINLLQSLLQNSAAAADDE
jgi:hypothetical protein